ncbi:MULTISPECIES: outer membrane beta-barrel protein [Roseivirga]|jgi:hypothetical protein|uniref:outer membrane beta-barrel protein n=1 Tax=Roseivirga TaxID=290180 RepID=UPI00257B8279|nr:MULTISPECIES: outer membrane beta-barrel protein [Roseivirga]MEC7754891.1 outer membrane beta-barrel protein [Bacteroidota bacterium]|tara:strand:- start:12952 stop:13494 length:543 start_codon:yes stop_codon:yes gene_type:complete
MKKLFLMGLLLFVGVTAQAQIQKGDVLLNGNLGYTKIDAIGTEISNFLIGTRGGLFLSEKTNLGLVLGYSSSKNNGTKNTLFTYGAYARFYKSLADNFYLFYQPQIDMGTGELGNSTDQSSFAISFRPGLSYFVTEKVALESTFGDISYTSQKVGNSESDRFNFNLNPNTLTFGISLLLR